MNSTERTLPCREVDPEVMFPEDLAGKPLPNSHPLVAEAKAVCAGCSDKIRTACALGALQRREEYGVWGGKTALELRSYRRQRDRKGWASQPALPLGATA